MNFSPSLAFLRALGKGYCESLLNIHSYFINQMNYICMLIASSRKLVNLWYSFPVRQLLRVLSIKSFFPRVFTCPMLLKKVSIGLSSTAVSLTGRAAACLPCPDFMKPHASRRCPTCRKRSLRGRAFLKCPRDATTATQTFSGLLPGTAIC